MRSGARHNHKTVSAGLAATFVVLTLGIAYVALMKWVIDSEQPVPARKKPVVATAPVKASSKRAEPVAAVAPVAAAESTTADAAPPDDAEPLLWPIRETKLSSRFGYRINPVTHDDQMHHGVDVPVPCGSHVLAVDDGEVVASEWTETGGNLIKIAHDGGWYTVYMHLARVTVREGTKVKAGALIGFSGQTGRLVTGPHLHFEVWKGKTAYDPTRFEYKVPVGPAAAPPSPYASCGPGAVRRSTVARHSTDDVEDVLAAMGGT